MILISHRGNINGEKPAMENTKEYIQQAINQGYHVEIDVWLKDKELFLGHDEPEHSVDLQWLLNRRGSLWIHTKNFKALSYLVGRGMKLFFHEKESHAIIHATDLIWSHNLAEANENSVIPLLSYKEALRCRAFVNVSGVCSDFVAVIRTCLGEE